MIPRQKTVKGNSSFCIVTIHFTTYAKSIVPLSVELSSAGSLQCSCCQSRTCHPEHKQGLKHKRYINRILPVNILRLRAECQEGTELLPFFTISTSSPYHKSPKNQPHILPSICRLEPYPQMYKSSGAHRAQNHIQ